MEQFINSFIKIIITTGRCIIDHELYQVWRNDSGDRYIVSKDNTFHMIFIKKNGFTIKWGRTLDEDPLYNPFGPEIADIELTKRCSGIRNEQFIRTPCPWCYKSNLEQGDYMTFETFKNIFDKINKSKTLTQIAFGTDASLLESANPDYWKIFEYCNFNNVTPNITIADIVQYETAIKLVNSFGAIAVSYYPQIDKNRCYNNVNTLTGIANIKGKLMDINIHALVSKETLPDLYKLIEDTKKDKRLKRLNAIVFLSLKQKGRGINFHQISSEEFKDLIDTCFKNNIKFGFDSCSANKFINAIKDKKDYYDLIQYVEPCESTLFSMYVDCYGQYYPCSFMEKEKNWKNGINLLTCNDFIKDVWNADKVINWRNAALNRIKNNGCNYCPYYDI